MKAIGGYFGLECGKNAPYHAGAFMLNTARNALRYIIRAYNIDTMYVPFYTCPVVWDAVQAENCKIIPYDLTQDFLPAVDIPQDAFVLYNNYFGINGRNIEELARKYKNLIVDNAQGFYQPHHGIASLYSPRKFFGLPDGGMLICDRRLPDDFETSVSFDMCGHLLKRTDMGASFGYADFQRNDESLIGQPIKKMSKLTTAIMGNIDYERARQQRIANFMFLHNALGGKNQIDINLSASDVPMVYPFKTTDAGLRAKLIENQVFVAKYWPAAENDCMRSDLAQSLANTIVPLPIDQRYAQSDMQRILEIING